MAPNRMPGSVTIKFPQLPSSRVRCSAPSKLICESIDAGFPDQLDNFRGHICFFATSSRNLGDRQEIVRGRRRVFTSVFDIGVLHSLGMSVASTLNLHVMRFLLVSRESSKLA